MVKSMAACKVLKHLLVSMVTKTQREREWCVGHKQLTHPLDHLVDLGEAHTRCLLVKRCVCEIQRKNVSVLFEVNILLQDKRETRTSVISYFLLRKWSNFKWHLVYLIIFKYDIIIVKSPWSLLTNGSEMVTPPLNLDQCSAFGMNMNISQFSRGGGMTLYRTMYSTMHKLYNVGMVTVYRYSV